MINNSSLNPNLFQSFFEYYQSALVIINKEENIIYLNKVALTTFNLDSQNNLSFINLNYKKVFEPKINKTIEFAFQAINKSKQKYRVESLELNSNLIIGFSIQPFFNPSNNNKIDGYFITGLDVTEKIKHERIVIFGQLMLESITAPVFCINQNLDLVYINDPALKIYDLSVDKNGIINKHITSIFKPSLLTQIKKSINAINSTKKSFRLESINLSTLNKPKYIGVTAYPCKKEQKIIGYVFSGKDITEIILEEKRKAEYLKQINKLMAAVTDLQNSCYDKKSIKSVTNRKDELGALAQVFDKMAVELIRRESNLKKEMQRLESVFIDETKKKKQVKAITDSQFFKDLKEKAKELKARISN
ncbi:MAG: PAS domain-containing protein [Candidatus Margulisiibacteriota bacterium]|jgi:PAS domain-containing protein